MKRYIFIEDKNRESFQRWTDHRIEQLTVTTALVFALASAALGYALTLVSDAEIPVAKLATWPFFILVVAFLISFVSGVWVVFNRFTSFRETCEIIKLRDKGDDKALLEKLRARNDDTDSRTLLLFKIQIISFLLGGALFIGFIVDSNFDRVKAICYQLL